MGPIVLLKLDIDVKIGPKTVYPANTIEHGKGGFTVLVDDANQCVWLGYNAVGFTGAFAAGDGQYWTRLPWSAVRYIAYGKPEDGPEAA